MKPEQIMARIGKIIEQAEAAQAEVANEFARTITILKQQRSIVSDFDVSYRKADGKEAGRMKEKAAERLAVCQSEMDTLDDRVRGKLHDAKRDGR